MQLSAWRNPLYIIAALFLMTSCSKCTEQHDPTADRALFKRESEHANSYRPTLTADGKIPAPANGSTPPADPITAKYEQFCTPCHGSEGRGDGAGAAALNPKPRNFAEAAWQNSVDDARIAKVIREGGASVGLSASMTAWGAILNEEEIKGIVAKVRQLGGK